MRALFVVCVLGTFLVPCAIAQSSPRVDGADLVKEGTRLADLRLAVAARTFPYAEIALLRSAAPRILAWARAHAEEWNKADVGLRPSPDADLENAALAGLRSLAVWKDVGLSFEEFVVLRVKADLSIDFNRFGGVWKLADGRKYMAEEEVKIGKLPPDQAEHARLVFAQKKDLLPLAQTAEKEYTHLYWRDWQLLSEAVTLLGRTPTANPVEALRRLPATIAAAGWGDSEGITAAIMNTGDEPRHLLLGSPPQESFRGEIEDWVKSLRPVDLPPHSLTVYRSKTLGWGGLLLYRDKVDAKIDEGMAGYPLSNLVGAYGVEGKSLERHWFKQPELVDLPWTCKEQDSLAVSGIRKDEHPWLSVAPGEGVTVYNDLSPEKRAELLESLSRQVGNAGAKDLREALGRTDEYFVVVCAAGAKVVFRVDTARVDVPGPLCVCISHLNLFGPTSYGSTSAGTARILVVEPDMAVIDKQE